MKTYKFFNPIIVIALIVILLGIPTNTFAQSPDPRVEVHLNQNGVFGTQWPLGSIITLTVDDPSVGPGPEYSDTQEAAPYWEPGFGSVWFELGSILRLRPGLTVSLTDGNITKEHVIRDVRVTDFDYDADTISGSGDPYGAIQVYVGGARRDVVADQDGKWIANFSQPGDQDWEYDIFDVNPGMPMNEGQAIQWDNPGNNDWDQTQITFPVYFSVSIGGDWIYGSNWFVGEPVTLTIDDPDTPDSPDYVDTAMPQVGPWVLTGVEFPFEVQPGYVITMSQGETIKSHVVSSTILITGVNPDTDIVYGEAAPLAYVMVGASGGMDFRTVRAGQNGDWTADFSATVLPWEKPVDITSETNVSACESDEDADSACAYWQWPWILTLKGLYQPVDMNGVYNVVKGGSTVPLKFEIFDGSTELTDIAYIKSLTYAQTSCDTNATTDEVETTATGNTSLRYADGQFIYNWKTPNTAGKCYRVTMTTVDGSLLEAYFKFK